MDSINVESDIFYTQQAHVMDSLLRADSAHREALRTLPKGSLIRRNINGCQLLSLQFFEGEKKRYQYMNEADGEEYAKGLATRKGHECALRHIQKNVRQMTRLFHGMGWALPPGAEDIVSRGRAFYSALPYDQSFPRSADKDAWLHTLPLIHNMPEYHPEGLRHPTLKGEKVRSKIEQIVANILFMHGLTYCFEPVLNLGQGIARPDFATCSAIDGAVFLIECNGKMRDPEYRENWQRRRERYAACGFLEGSNLIVFYDDQARSLDSRQVQSVLCNHLGLYGMER